MSTTPPSDPHQSDPTQAPQAPAEPSDPTTVDPETGTDPDGSPVENPSG
jgi:hypothetical protein